MELPEEVDDLLRSQLGLATVSQLQAAGMSRSELRWRLNERWQKVLPRVVAAFKGSLDARQRLVAALLHAGPAAALGSLTAAAWHGVHAAGGDPRVHLLVPAGHTPTCTGPIVIRRTRRPDPSPWKRGPLLVCSPARAVIDAARDAPSADQAQAIVIEAAQRGIASLPMLRHELEMTARRGSARVRSALQNAEAGAWSVPEAGPLRLLAASAVLPPAWPNPELVAADGTRLPRPDAWIDDVALAIQVHSRRHHAGRLDWEATVMSDGVYAEHGVMALGVTPRAIEHEPDRVLARVERTYTALRSRPRPAVRAAPSGHGVVS